MLDERAFNWIDDCEWIEPIEEGVMGDHYLEETYRIKDGAPDDVKKRWEDTCAEFRDFG